ncbi:hypothetical protein [Amycolatopsis sp. CA-230715]|uniref:hypothetical protein n=1 Tax=Amycolatopsis sp. CA-230715 TaxID=2745196 RepID=UPI001C0109A6|nr:hypothetical protein [Amycolatopsis sp. CA-230715]
MITSCSAAPPPPPAAAPPPAELTAAAALGDFTTVDFCSLLDLPPLTGGAKPRETIRSFSTCVVALPDAQATTVGVGPITNDAQRESWETDYPFPGALPPGVRVEQTSKEDGPACTRYLAFADSVRLTVSIYDSDTAGKRCAKADKAVAGALAAVTEKRVQHVDYPAKSLARIDPCTILAGREADAALEDEYPPGPIGLGKHSCTKALVEVTFLSARTFDGTATVTVAGQTLSQLRDKSSCKLRAERLSNGRGEAVVFTANEVDAPATAESCARAEKVAEFVLPKLPA